MASRLTLKSLAYAALKGQGSRHGADPLAVARSFAGTLDFAARTPSLTSRQGLVVVRAPQHNHLQLSPSNESPAIGHCYMPTVSHSPP